jgi:hypothetical protein
MSSAKEGGRTPTRVTSLEPEGTARERNAKQERGVRSDSGVNVVTHDAAANREAPQNTGACTASPEATFRHAPIKPGVSIRVNAGLSHGLRGRVVARSVHDFGAEPVWVVELVHPNGDRRDSWLRETFLQPVGEPS